MARSVGIDLGSHSVKIVGIETHGKNVRITRFQDRALPRTTEEGSATQLIAEMFKELKLPRDLVTLGFDAYASVIRKLSVPFKNPDQIRKIIKYESEGQLFSFGIDEVVIDFVKIRENLDSSDLIVVAVVKQLLAEKLKVVEEAYVDPVLADLDLLGHFNSLALTPYLEEHPSLALLDIGYKSSKLIVVQDGRPVLLRGMRVGMSSVVNAIQQETTLNLQAAETKVLERFPVVARALEARAEDGAAAADDVVVVLQDDEDLPEPSDLDRSREDLEDELLVEKTDAVRIKLVREVQRTLAGLTSTRPADLLLLTGGGSLIPGLSRALETSLNLEVKPFNVLDHVEHPFSEDERAAAEPFISAAIGLAAKNVGRDASATNFRREELAFQKRFEQIKVPLTLCLGLLLVFLGLVFWRFRSDYKLRAQEYDQLNWQVLNMVANGWKEPSFQRYVDSTRKDENGNPVVLLSEIKAPRFQRHLSIYRKLMETRRALNREMGQISGSDEHFCALNTWNELFKRLRLAQQKIGTDLSPILPYVRINQDGVNCNMILRDYEKELSEIQRAFEGSETLLMREARNFKAAKDVEGNDPRVLVRQQFDLKNKKARPR